MNSWRLPLADGTAIHAGLEALYRGRDDAEVADVVKRGYISEFGDLSEYSADTRAFMNERIQWGVKLLSAYRMRQLPLDDFLVVHVEQDFEVVLGEICYACGEPYAVEATSETCPHCGAEVVFWVGRSDLVVSREGLVRVVDHKTVKSASADTIARYNHSMQMVGYCYGVSKDTGNSVRGFGMNLIKKLKTIDPPTVRCKGCKGQGCGDCNLSGRVEKAPPELFLRKWVTIGHDDLDRFVLSRLRIASDIINERERFKSCPEEAYPINEDACYKFGEENKCPFIPLCWGGDPLNWYAPSDARLANFNPKKRRTIEV
jgi:hypothetical protein